MSENTWLLNAHLNQTFLGPPWTWLSCPTLVSRPVFIFSHFGTNENFHLTTFFKVCPTCFWPRPPRPSPPPRFPSFSYSFLLKLLSSLDFTWFYIHLGSMTFNTFWYETLHPRCALSLLARSWCATGGAYTASSEYRLYCTTTSSSVSRRSEHAQLLSCSNAQQAAGGLWLGEWLSHILGKACQHINTLARDELHRWSWWSDHGISGMVSILPAIAHESYKYGKRKKNQSYIIHHVHELRAFLIYLSCNNRDA